MAVAGYQIRYRPEGGFYTPWEDVGDLVDFQIENLEDDTVYTVQVRAYCTTGSLSGFSAPYTFKTPPGCGIIDGGGAGSNFADIIDGGGADSAFADILDFNCAGVVGPTTEGIRFYDMGWMLQDGVWQELPFVDPEKSVAMGNDGTQFTNIDNDGSASLYAIRDELIFDIPKEEWPTTFKLIDESIGDDYTVFGFWNEGGGMLNSSNPDFNAGVWTPDGDFEYFGISYQVGYEAAYYGEGSVYGHYLTSEPDPNATPLTINLGKNFDVFILPRLIHFQGHMQLQRNVPPVFTELDRLGFHAAISPRYPYLDPTHPTYGTLVHPFANSLQSSWNQSNPTAATDWPVIYKLFEYMRDYMAGPQRAGRMSYNHGTATYTFTTPMSLASFPNPTFWPAPPSTPINTSPNYNQGAVGFYDLAPGVPYLLAVIKLGNSYYYLWNPGT